MFFVNEYMHGSSVAFHLERVHHFEENYVRFFTAQILCAIEFLQQNYKFLL